jgi:hypothetical protein
MGGSMTPCKYCKKPFDPVDPDQMFCTPRHKAAWHKENVVHGVVTNVRPLKRGGYHITVKYDAVPKGMLIGGHAWVETVPCTRTDAATGENI